MPNLCKGDMRVKGKKDCIISFLINCIENIRYSTNDIAEKTDKYNYFECYHGWIKGTSRGFASDIDIDIELCDFDENNNITVSFRVEFAWDCDAKEIKKICNKYNIDARLYLFEKGMRFNRDIEIIDGKITKDNTIKFDDYEWDCIMPNLGG